LRGAPKVTVLARTHTRLRDVERLGADAIEGDATDAALMDGLVADIKPSALILNAGATPQMGPIDKQSFESFSAVWNNDVKATLHGVQAALKAPMPKGGRVLLVSSGAAMVLSLPTIRPEAMRLSGGYIGAKRVIWLMAHNANGVARESGLGLHFQVLLPLQLVGETGLGRSVAAVQATEITMHLISIARRTLVQFVSASAVRIALSATLTTPQPAAALQAVIDTLAEPFVPTVLPAGQTAGSAAPTRDRQAPMPGIVGPGLGWG
jgi:short chain dehydrogenase